MKTKWKVALGVAGPLLIAGGVYGSIQYGKKGIVTVQTGKSARQDLTALVTASGEIKPRNYINIGSNANGPARITQILVLEGQSVRKGQLLAQLESVQPEAEVAAQKAGVSSTEAESAASEAGLNVEDENIKTLQASLERSRTDLEKAKINFARVEQLQAEKLIAKRDYDDAKISVDAAAAGVREAEARLPQAKARRAQLVATLTAAQRRIVQSQANLKRAQDVLARTQAVSPIDGMVTNLPVRMGETVVPGIQNSAASLIMTIADMSFITAEVKVDETDIVNVKLDQSVDVTIDAIPGKTYKGKVIEIGNTAILRSTGLAASQSAISSQEAKDFKVVVKLLDPPSEIRPGLSCTAKVVTAVRQNVLTIPIQALTVRQQGDLEPEPAKDAPPKNLTPAQEKERRKELQGVFVVKGDQVSFQKVDTGITGATDIEVLTGLTDGQEIVTGSYKIIRTIKPGAKIKVDNKAPVKTES